MFSFFLIYATLSELSLFFFWFITTKEHQMTLAEIIHTMNQQDQAMDTLIQSLEPREDIATAGERGFVKLTTEEVAVYRNSKTRV